MNGCTIITAVVNSPSGANKNHLTLFNNAGQFPLEVWRIDAQAHYAATSTSTGLSLYAHRTTAAGTNGTASVFRRMNNRALALPASIESRSNVTLSPAADTEVAGLSISTEEAGNAVTGNQPLFLADPSKGIDPLLLWSGEGLVVRQGALASAGAVSVFIYFRIKHHKQERSRGLRY